MAAWLDTPDGLVALRSLETRLAQCQEALALGGGVGPIAAATVQRPEGDLPPETALAFAVTSVLLVIFAGLMAGLTLGLLSLDK